MKSLFYIVVMLMLLASCHSKPKTQGMGGSLKDSTYTQYAKGFKVTDCGAYKLIDVQDPTGENDLTYHYALVKRGEKVSDIPVEYKLIETPVKRVICMTALQLSNFIKLKAVDRVVGMTSTRFLFNEQMKEQLKNGKSSRIGIEGDFDTELVMALQADLILVSPFKRGGYEAIRNLDIPLVSFLGYKESSPLGQAEWIKFTALLLGMEEEANERFRQIEERYNYLKSLTLQKTKRPTAMSGELHSGNWYVVGGNSYLAQLFRDAGADYFMKNDNESGGFYLDFETVYSQGAETDYWRIVNSYNGEYDYSVLEQTDSRYVDFASFKNKKVIYCNLREKPFYEQTPVEPEVVLADLIRIFHPDLLPGHAPVYYDLLK
ncbi:ABC transporter substrate-binding protein [Porphyromonadaceae bacterium OttesenSCG-928-L07]|nr:ABC transporter substrate-binding protein [Porphyromonadaceae bacterium OttesenSCG-928-L07]MDL2252130.1 ABC transporter substrate-binding protein [Odoribacter sp. OttesenSCG-928-J03]